MGWGKVLRLGTLIGTEVLGAGFLYQRQSFPLKSRLLQEGEHTGCSTLERGPGEQSSPA